MMKRVVFKSYNFSDAELWDIKQQIKMSPEERQKAAKELKTRVFKKSSPDVREQMKKK